MYHFNDAYWSLRLFSPKDIGSILAPNSSDTEEDSLGIVDPCAFLPSSDDLLFGSRDIEPDPIAQTVFGYDYQFNSFASR